MHFFPDSVAKAVLGCNEMPETITEAQAYAIAEAINRDFEVIAGEIFFDEKAPQDQTAGPFPMYSRKRGPIGKAKDKIKAIWQTLSNWEPYAKVQIAAWVCLIGLFFGVIIDTTISDAEAPIWSKIYIATLVAFFCMVAVWGMAKAIEVDEQRERRTE